MAIIFKNKCPCIGCKYLTISKVSFNYFCNKKKQYVQQHHGNSFHSAGQWIIPCGKDMWGYESMDNCQDNF